MTTLPKPHEAGSAYRADIDGLRAVAVLLVVFNHLLKVHCRGGYVGVDVFFVISGYLIGATILSEMRAGTFSIVNFYERRIRRIFPALFVMLAVASALAYRYFLPGATISFSVSLLAALLSISNMLFWKQSNYFDMASASKPLLHTWSLGVEEQFYIVFPLFLMVIHRWAPRAMKAALWTVVTISFVFAVRFANQPGDSAAFYFSPLRAWELLLGAIASQGYLPKLREQMQRDAASLVGLLLILIPAMMYSSTTRFPGLAALPPVLGAVLLIVAGEMGSSLIGKALSWRPMVFVGLISYSLYLWHWPIKVFLDASLVLHRVSNADKIGEISVLAASLVIATLSWRFVETPFRKGKFRPGRTWLFVMSGLGAVILGAVGFLMLKTLGLPSRFSSDVVQTDHFSMEGVGPGWEQCFVATSSTMSDEKLFAKYDKAACLHDDAARKQYLLFGDSEAADKYAGLASVFPELNISQATVAGCPPLMEEDADRSANCKRMSAFIFGDFLLHHHVDGVVLTAQWTEGNLPELGRTVRWIEEHDMQAIVIGPGFTYGLPMPQVIAMWLRDGHADGFVESFRETWPEALDREMAEKARTQWKARYISIYDDLCASQPEMVAKAQPESTGGCPVYGTDETPLLLDTNHFSPGGSVLLARAMRDRGQLP